MEGIGSVLFERSKKARHLSITVRSVDGVRVAVPLRVSWKSAVEMAYSKSAWIKKHQERIKQTSLKHEASFTGFSGIDRNLAKRALINRLDELSKKNGLPYNRVFIRNQRTLWGSCSLKNNINLNIKLTRLPEDLRDYVILHELVHTRIKNHKKAFWTELDKYSGNAKEVHSRLNEYGLFLS
ncbi:MAG: DUF45 domain-containing protein [Candidatus Aminicenantes bacterium]|nr:DUF45 domain-containing protein [Candidatus Aminicenantes bacterium]